MKMAAFNEKTERLTSSGGDNNFQMYFLLLVMFFIKVSEMWQQQALGYFYGYQVPADATKEASFYSMVSSYPDLESFYGFLSGPIFSIAFASASLYWGRAADKGNRSTMLALAAIAWSLSSLATGSFNSLPILAISRFVLGAAQASCEPLMYSLVTDAVPKNLTSTVYGLLTAGPYLGSAICGLTILAVERIGWRGCYQAMGLSGVLFGIAQLVFIREPKRKQLGEQAAASEHSASPNVSVMDSLFGLTKNPVTWYATLGASFRAIIMFSLDYFLPAFFLITYPEFKQ